MKTKKWTSFAAAIAVLLLGSSCQDWGEMDPAAGNQVTPTLENVATFSFDEPELDPIVYKTYANADGQLPSVVEDDVKGNVLSLNNGYVTLNNPLNSVKVQKAVSMTFWMKQPLVVNVDDEGNETTEPQDLTGALIAFENENATSKMFFTANGWIKYNGMDGEWEDNNPATYATGYIPAGDWHYVALIMRNDGYGLYVDGQQKVEKKVTDFDCSKMVQFLNNVSKMYIGSTETSKPWMIDDLKIYRNEITAKEIARPNIGNGGGQGPSDDTEYEFPPKGTVGYYLLDNSFENHLNPAQTGSFTEVETQTTPSAFEIDPIRGTVWHQQEGWSGHENGWGYTKFTNPLNGADLSKGVTVSMWINPPVINWWDQIFVLNDGTAKFWFNAVGYVGFNSGVGPWFDCQQNNNTNEMTAGEWTLVTISINPAGFQVYYNGELKFDNENNGAFNSADMGDYTPLINMFASCSDFYLGYETFWKAAPALIDDIYLCAEPMTASQAKAMYNATKK